MAKLENLKIVNNDVTVDKPSDVVKIPDKESKESDMDTYGLEDGMHIIAFGFRQLPNNTTAITMCVNEHIMEDRIYPFGSELKGVQEMISSLDAKMFVK